MMPLQHFFGTSLESFFFFEYVIHKGGCERRTAAIWRNGEKDERKRIFGKVFSGHAESALAVSALVWLVIIGAPADNLRWADEPLCLCWECPVCQCWHHWLIAATLSACKSRRVTQFFDQRRLFLLSLHVDLFPSY